MVTAQPPSGPALPVPFAWRAVPDADRDWLKKRTQDIEGFIYRTACDIIRIGQILAEIKKRLPRRYEAWLLASTPFSRSQARRLRMTAKVFDPFIGQIEQIEPSALYVLADGKTPHAAREHAVQLATEGKRITHAYARQILDAHRDPEFINKADVNSYQTARNRVCADDDREQVRTEKLEEQDTDRAAKIGLALTELVERVSIVEFAKHEDGEFDTMYAVTTYDPQDGPRTTCDRDLGLAVARAAGSQEYKFCAGCCVKDGEELPEGVYGPVRPAIVPTNLFGRDRRTPDLLMMRCNPCERLRKKEIRVRKTVATPTT